MLNNLNALAADIHQANKDKGFWNTYYTLQETPPAERPAYQEDVVNALRVRCLALAAGELSEGIEAIRKGRNANPVDLEVVQQKVDAGEEWKTFFGIKVKDTEEDEIADAIIRLLDYAGARGIDLEKHIELKLAYNSSRPYLHGKTF